MGERPSGHCAPSLSTVRSFQGEQNPHGRGTNHSAFHFHAGPALSGSPPFFAARLGHALLWRGWQNLLRWAANGLRAAIRGPEPDPYPPLPSLAPTSHRHQNAAARRVRGFGPPSSTGRFLSDRTEVWGAGATPGAVGHGCNLALAHRAANFGEFLAVAEDSRSDRLTPWAELLRG